MIAQRRICIFSTPFSLCHLFLMAFTHSEHKKRQKIHFFCLFCYFFDEILHFFDKFQVNPAFVVYFDDFHFDSVTYIDYIFYFLYSLFG